MERMRARFALLVTAALLGPSAGCAQSERSDGNPSSPLAQSVEQRVFTVPEDSAVACTVLSPDSVRGADLGYRFEIGTAVGDRRLITASYDSLGTPVSIQVVSSASTAATGATVDGIVARFGDTKSIGLHTHKVERPNRAVGDTAFNLRPLEEWQLDRARSLVGWLWTKRCG